MKKISLITSLCLISFVLLFYCAPVQAETTGAPSKTIKIGVSTTLGVKFGLGLSRSIQVLADMDNQKGGLNIGGEKYKVEIVVYDTKFNMDVVMSNINRMIFEDKIKFVVADPIMTGAWLPLADENGVVVAAGGTFPQIFNKNFRYAFQTGLSNTNAPVLLAWFRNKYPEKKTLIFAAPDTEAGREFSAAWKQSWEAFGGKITLEYYPMMAQDLSALATKVKMANPDVFSTLGGMNDQAVVKAVIDAGYKGTHLTMVTPQDLATVIPMSLLEGFIYWQPCMICDPPPCKIGKAFKSAYTAKYGKWDYPVTLFSTGYSAITTAMQQTGSTDPQKVADAMNNGLEFESTEGPVRMISRPDLGIDRTVDSIHPLEPAVIKNGKMVPLEVIDIEQGLKWFRKIYK